MLVVSFGVVILFGIGGVVWYCDLVRDGGVVLCWLGRLFANQPTC